LSTIFGNVIKPNVKEIIKTHLIEKNTFPVDIANSPNCFHLDSLCTSVAIPCKRIMNITLNITSKVRLMHMRNAKTQKPKISIFRSQII